MKILHNFNACFESFRYKPYSSSQYEENGRIVYRHEPKDPNIKEDHFSEIFNDIAPEPNSIVMGRPFLAPVGENYDRLCFSEWRLQLDEFNDKIFMMTSGYMPLNHLVQHQSEAVIIFDINPIQIIFWELTLNYIRQHEKVNDFFDALQKTGQQDYEQEVTKWLGQDCPEWLKSFGYSDGINNSVEQLFKKSYGASWKQNKTIVKQKNYDYLRQLTMHNAIAIIALDAYDTKAIKIVSHTLKNNSFTKITLENNNVIAKYNQKGAEISVQYISNIFERRLGFNFFSNEPILFEKTNGLTELWDRRKKSQYDLISAGHAWNRIIGEQGCLRISGMEPALRFIEASPK